ncbi:MAG: GNAT family N-acetyltransferase [bacterium]|nr:GNAT family N-acetyltransferase [bacterium]
MPPKEFQLKELRKFSKKLKDELSQLLTQLSQTRERIDEKVLKKALKSPNTVLFGLFHNDKLIGTGTLIIMDTFASPRGFVHDLVIDKEYRSRGLAHKIMDEIIKRAKKHKLTELSLTSRAHRKTEKFFKECGFEKRQTNCFRMDL